MSAKVKITVSIPDVNAQGVQVVPNLLDGGPITVTADTLQGAVLLTQDAIVPRVTAAGNNLAILQLIQQLLNS